MCEFSFKIHHSATRRELHNEQSVIRELSTQLMALTKTPPMDSCVNLGTDFNWRFFYRPTKTCLDLTGRRDSFVCVRT